MTVSSDKSVNAWRLRPQAPQPGTVLGPLDAIGSGSAKEYVFGVGLNAFRMFVVRQGDALHAYVNLCPHYSQPLNVRPDEFLSRNGDRIMCRRHLAIFSIDGGECLDGACDGNALDAIPLHVSNGNIVIG